MYISFYQPQNWVFFLTLNNKTCLNRQIRGLTLNINLNPHLRTPAVTVWCAHISHHPLVFYLTPHKSVCCSQTNISFPFICHELITVYPKHWFFHFLLCKCFFVFSPKKKIIIFSLFKFGLERAECVWFGGILGGSFVCKCCWVRGADSSADGAALPVSQPGATACWGPPTLAFNWASFA